MFRCSFECMCTANGLFLQSGGLKSTDSRVSNNADPAVSAQARLQAALKSIRKPSATAALPRPAPDLDPPPVPTLPTNNLQQSQNGGGQPSALKQTEDIGGYSVGHPPGAGSSGETSKGCGQRYYSVMW